MTDHGDLDAPDSDIDSDIDAEVETTLVHVVTTLVTLAETLPASTYEPERGERDEHDAPRERGFLLARVIWLAAPLSASDLASTIRHLEGLGAK